MGKLFRATKRSTFWGFSLASQKPQIVVFVSGSGSNLQALIDACANSELDAEVAAVFSNRKAAYGLERAKNHNIPAVYVPYSPFRDSGREAYDAALANQVAQFNPDLIVLAGWMRIFTPEFLDRFPGRIINLHPALHGTYIGAHGIDWAFEAFQNGEIEHGGCMVHYAIPQVDEGAPIAETIVPIYKSDTLDDYAQRLHAAEHPLLVKATSIVLKTLAE